MEVVSARAGALPAPLETLKIGKSLGKGGFAVVRSGTLRTTEGTFPVAVKVLHPEFSDEASQELRLFKEEAELMLQLNHRNIITAYGLLKLPPNFPGLEGHTQPAYALILEMMEGGSLARLMVKQLLAGAVAKYTFSQALGWLIDVARALQYLHNGGKDGFPRIHRDVKLENVLLTAGMKTAKLADFGLQRAVFAQRPEQHQHQQQAAMLVRRSMRSSVTLPRGGPAGPSRLAPDSERTSLRQGSAAKLLPFQQQHQLLPSAVGQQERRSSPSGFTAVQQYCSDAADEPLGGSDPVFYAVDNKGLTPLVLPNSPQQPASSQPACTPEALARPDRPELSRLGAPGTQSGGLLGRVLEHEIARRSRSTSQLEQLSGDKDPWPAALVAVASSARGGGTAAVAAQQQPRAASGGGVNGGGGGAMPGQLLSANQSAPTSQRQLVSDNMINDSDSNADKIVANSEGGSRVHRSNSALLPREGPALQVVVPPSPTAQGSPSRHSLMVTGASSRSLLLGAAGSSPSAARPSPLGPATPARGPDSLTDGASRFDSSFPAGGSPRGQPAAFDGGPPLTADRGRETEPHSRSSGGPASRDMAAPAPPAPPSPLFASISVPCGSGSASGCQLPDGLAPPPVHGAPTAGLAALEAARQSRTSLREVVLESAPSVKLSLPPPPQDSTVQDGGPSSAQSRAAPSGASSMRPFGSTAPGAFAGGSGAAAAATTVAAARSGRRQFLTAEAYKSDQGADVLANNGGNGGNGGAGVAIAIGAVLRSTQSAACSSAVPQVAVDSAARADYLAPRAGTASGMIGGGGGGGVPDRERSSLGRAVGVAEVRSSGTRISVVAAARPHGGRRASGCENAMPAGAAAPAGVPIRSPPSQLHMADLLHLRLGAQNISVRSVRSSASGALNRQLVGSAPSSPRLAAVAAAARAAAAGAGLGGQQDTAAPVVVATRSSRAGSLPGDLGTGRAQSGAIKAAGPVADFEEVFSLTGRTGSLMYLAPEAYKNEPYNDKVDVYSLAVLMYELFGRTSITYTHISTKLPAFSRMLCNPDEFAERVAAGYRPPRTNTMSRMPPQLWELIEASWHQDPVQRPDITTVLEALEELVEPVADAEAGRGPGGHLAPARCGCVIC